MVIVRILMSKFGFKNKGLVNLIVGVVNHSDWKKMLAKYCTNGRGPMDARIR
jgi:hypothetical protein